ncbi:DUF397 domain-containing protein [Streptomyces sp. B6B3]|uniref:DUF397 domain-containing protein n=1 Tax=Streptomyces sp. B6B3 TaxID=3153570 RepID=UPI00325C6225
MDGTRKAGIADLRGATWRTSSYTAGNGNCVEVATLSDRAGVAIRDSKDRRARDARASREAWEAFMTALASDSL